MLRVPIESMARMLFIILLAFLPIAVVGCSPLHEPAEISVVKEYSNNSIEMLFCPADKCFIKIYNLIEKSNSSIHCAFFSIDNKEIVNLLELKSMDLDVKLVVDDSAYKKLNNLDFVHKDTTSQLMHNKFCIFDNNTVLAGSLNPTESAYSDNNNMLIFSSMNIAAAYESEFSELWDGYFGKKSSIRKENKLFYINEEKIEIYFCPEDWCTNKVLKELYAANSSIHFMTYSFTSKQIAELLAEKLVQGLEVNGIIEKSQKNAYWQYDFLLNSSVKVILDKNSRLMHNKVFLIDNSTVITGSFNPTSNAEFNNDENLIIIHSPALAERYLKEFDYLYSLWS